MNKKNGNIKILDEKISNTFKIKFDYILIECVTCGKKWGKNLLEGNELEIESCLCQACAVKKIASEM
jgi:hypothetical protein